MTRTDWVEQAAKLMVDADRYAPMQTWRGHSGEEVSGEDAARFLEATLALLEKKGWTGGRDDKAGDNDTTPLDGVDEGSVLDMVRGMFRWLRDELREEFHVDAMWKAMLRLEDTRHGDSDTGATAGRVLRLLIQVRTGAVCYSVSDWEGRRGRTWDEVRDLLQTGAEFAREYGPKGGA